MWVWVEGRGDAKQEQESKKAPTRQRGEGHADKPPRKKRSRGIKRGKGHSFWLLKRSAMSPILAPTPSSATYHTSE